MVIWVATTITFFIPRLSSKNPIRERFAELSRTGGFSPQDLEKIIEAFNKQFGLDKPLLEQYSSYMGSVLRGDFGYSLRFYPSRVEDIIRTSLPYSISLLVFAALMSFLIGNFLGALSAWPRTPRWLKGLATPLIILKGVHPVVLGIVLINIVAFQLKLLPITGTYTPGSIPSLKPEFLLDVVRHLTLPAISLVLATAGGWAMAMRGMGVTVQGEDYVNFAEHKGLRPSTIFGNYFVRNAILPQVTAFALDLGALITSGLLVEGLYGIQGLGLRLGEAVTSNDFPVIYGIIIFIIIGVSIMMLISELLYPLFDPRVKLENK
jgi:peptide/nickel transport system permease protein